MIVDQENRPCSFVKCSNISRSVNTRTCRPSEQRLRDINLHWHDLRHEYASKLVERDVPLAQVRDLLGHASILTTERYDNQRLEALQAAVERLEGGKTFDPADGSRGQSVKNLSGSHQTELRRQRRPRQGIREKSLTVCGLESWYRYGDSNPGRVAEKRFCSGLRTDRSAVSVADGPFRAQSFKNLSSGQLALRRRGLARCASSTAAWPAAR
jgi:hypothetical protein